MSLLTNQRGTPNTPTSPTTTVRIIRVALGCSENVDDCREHAAANDARDQ